MATPSGGKAAAARAASAGRATGRRLAGEEGEEEARDTRAGRSGRPEEGRPAGGRGGSRTAATLRGSRTPTAGRTLPVARTAGRTPTRGAAAVLVRATWPARAGSRERGSGCAGACSRGGRRGEAGGTAGRQGDPSSTPGRGGRWLAARAAGRSIDRCGEAAAARWGGSGPSREARACGRALAAAS